MTTFEVGAKVYSPKYGKGRVVGFFPTACQANMPMCVEFKRHTQGLHTAARHVPSGNGRWYDMTGKDEEGDQLTLRPSRWHPASEPPDSKRNVRVKLPNGRKWYGYWYINAWRVMADDVDVTRLGDPEYCRAPQIADPDEIVAWRELKRKAKPTQPHG